MPDETTQSSGDAQDSEPTAKPAQDLEPAPVKLDSLVTGQDPAPTTLTETTPEAPILEPTPEAVEVRPVPEASNPPTEIVPAEPLPKEPAPMEAPTAVPEVPNEPKTAPTPPSPEATPQKPPETETAQTERFEAFTRGNPAKQARKRKRLDKLFDFFSKKPQVSNDDVEKLLRVSDATATRYLNQLESEGKIQQVGKTGRGVKYTRLRYPLR